MVEILRAPLQPGTDGLDVDPGSRLPDRRQSGGLQRPLPLGPNPGSLLYNIGVCGLSLTQFSKLFIAIYLETTNWCACWYTEHTYCLE